MQDTILANQIGVSALMVYALEAVKKAPWFPWITAHTDNLNRVIAFTVAFLTSIGFSINISGNWQTGGTLLVSLPSAGVLISVLMHSMTQAGIQEAFYQTVVKKETKASENKALSTDTATVTNNCKTTG